MKFMDFNNKMDKLDEQKSNMDVFLANMDTQKKLQLQKERDNANPYKQQIAVKQACDKCRMVSLDKMLGKIYKDAIPVDGDPIDVDQDISDYINTRTKGKDASYYIHEAIKKNKSPFLTSMLEAADYMARKHAKKKQEMINNGYNKLAELAQFQWGADEDKDLQSITSDMGMDEISDAIRNNVMNTIQDEQRKNAAEKEEMKSLEEQLAADDEIVDQPAMEKAISKEISKKRLNNEIYQPSLFEGIMKYYVESCPNDNNKDIYYKTICDYTMLSTMKALKLESFDNRLELLGMANHYKK
jgi:hypothetical protein